MVELRAAGPDDLPAIMRMERGPGFERLVARWDEAEHRAQLADPNVAYLLGAARNGEDAGVAAGVVILEGMAEPYGTLHFLRVAVERPGRGFGKPFLRAVVGWAFARPDIDLLHLDVFEGNARARRVYAAVGFFDHGLTEETYAWPDGSGHVGLVSMTLTRSEWRPGPSPDDSRRP